MIILLTQEVSSVPVLQGIINLLKFLNDNWTYIIVIMALGYALYKKIIDFIHKTKEEQQKEIEEAKKKALEAILEIINEVIEEKISNAELDWSEYKKAGSIKRSKVISEIYEQFPMLKDYLDQKYIINTLDDMIDEVLKKTRSIINDANKNT